MSESSAGVVRRYLEDVIDGERNVESQLEAFAARASAADSRELFRQSAIVTKRHHEQLTNRLRTLEGGVSSPKGFLSQLFSFSTKTTQGEIAHEEGSSQDLVNAFALAHSQLALCEVVAVTAEAASDPETASLCRSIQDQNKQVAQSLWAALRGHFPPSYAG